jgi:acyl-homoserine lactone acylase PvdQ
MDLIRRQARGTLSQVDAQAIDLDLVSQRLDFYGQAVEIIENMSELYIGRLMAFSAGVNAYRDS